MEPTEPSNIENRRVNMWLPQDLIERFQSAAKALGLSMSQYCAVAMWAQLERDRVQISDAMARRARELDAESRRFA